jgi:hypothetical protein
MCLLEGLKINTNTLCKHANRVVKVRREKDFAAHSLAVQARAETSSTSCSSCDFHRLACVGCSTLHNVTWGLFDLISVV